MQQLDSLLHRMSQVDDEAIIWRERRYTFRELNERRSAWLKQLEILGVQPGKVVGLRSDYSPAAISLFLALLSNRNIVALISPHAADEELLLKDSQAECVFRLDPQEIWEWEERASAVEHPLLTGLRDAALAGFVVFSSGSTGKPKAVLHSVERFLTKFTSASKKLRTLTFLLLDHIAGIDTLFYCLFSGSLQVFPQARDVKTICELIERHRIEVLPTAPTFLNLLWLSGEYMRHDLSSLKVVTYGAERMSQHLLNNLNDVLPQCRFVQKYGTSELGSPRSQSKGNSDLRIHIQTSECEVKVVDNLLWLRSPAAMLGYLNAPTPFDEDGWFCTGDEILSDGDWVQILGRKCDIINVGGEKVYPAEVEGVVSLMDGVEDVVVSGESNVLTGQIVTATVKLTTTETLPQFKKRMQRFCEGKITKFKIPQKVRLATKDLHGERFKKIRQPSEPGHHHLRPLIAKDERGS
jgi:long-chain acyl-CoA synthetase